MGRVKENGLRGPGEELEVLVPYKKISGRTKRPIEGQISFEYLEIKAEMPKTREDSRENEIKQISEVDLPVNKEYLDNNNVAFLDPKRITFIKNNILDLGKNRILKDANNFSANTDEEIIHQLVVFPNNTSLSDFHTGEELVFPGGILALPVKISGNYGPEQRFIYVGNFSNNEKRYQKRNTKYLLTNSKGNLVWRSMSVGEYLPANYCKAVRVEMSVNGRNEIRTHK